MALSASIEVKLGLGEDIYSVILNLPSTTPTAAAPFLFNVTSSPKNTTPPAAGAAPVAGNDLLAVAIGGSGEVYVAVAPPSSLLTTAGVGDLVQQLQVVVEDGDYDTTKHIFNTTT